MSNAVRNQDFEAYADEKPFNFSTNPVWKRLLDGLIAEAGKPVSSLSVLDNGCGDGKLYPALLSKGFDSQNIHGIEVSQKRIERCKAIGFANAQYLPLNAVLPYANESFDLINYLEVIEHVPANEIDFYLREMARVLKRDGVAIITTPNYPVKRVIDLYDAFVHKRWKRLRDDPTHVTFYNHISLRARLEKFFGRVDIQCYKEGLFYKRVKSPYLMHKMVAVCVEPKK
jgi:2-polyprenyl-3-methyl-5-hydroxy-6-metoxy-1,4-benzoquinol methylase